MRAMLRGDWTVNGHRHYSSSLLRLRTVGAQPESSASGTVPGADTMETPEWIWCLRSYGDAMSRR